MLAQIEKDIDVARITYRRVSIWPVIKSYLPGITGEFNIIKDATPATVRSLLRNLFPDLLSIPRIRKQLIWVFTNSERRYYINDTSFDRITTGLLRYLPGYVLFENPIPKGKTAAAKLQSGEYYLGMSWIFLLQYIVMKLSPTPRIENLRTLEEYLNKDLSKVRQLYARILAGEKVYSLLFRLFKPKALFVVCYYSNFGMILAAKKNEIPVIELQHGLVTRGHRAYYFSGDFGRAYFPDAFLSYGAYSSDIVSEGNVVRPKMVLNYGYYFLEEVNRELTISKELEEIKKEFKKVICITGQLPVTDEPLLNMIQEVSGSLKDHCFIYKPRYAADPAMQGTHNFREFAQINTYELLKYCDYHITVYSTCAMESLALGTPNICVDVLGYYSRYLKNMLDGNAFNFVVNTSGELTGVIRNLMEAEIDRVAVKRSISQVFSPMVSSETFSKFFNEIIDQKAEEKEKTLRSGEA